MIYYTVFTAYSYKVTVTQFLGIIILSLLLKLPLPIRSQSLNLLPRIAAPAFRFCPFSLKKAVLLPALRSVFKEAIEDGDFEFLENQWLSISVTDIGFEFWVSFANNDLLLSPPMLDKKHDASFKANSEDLLLIAGRKQDPDTLFFKRRLLIEGDTELGLEVKNLIDSIDLDSLPSVVHRFVEHSAQVIKTTRNEESKKAMI